jgi:SAM-dependent methyltransferase
MKFSFEITPLNFFGPRDIKKTVEQWIRRSGEELKDKKIADVPAGNGFTSTLLSERGAQVLAFDLFPENFSAEGLHCDFADLSQGIPLANAALDMIVCQEGIEHIPNQPKLLGEFNRVLKTGGKLLLTCPNASNLKGRLSALGESEYFGKFLPANPLESVWCAQDGKMYFGHVFLIGISRLRLFAHLAGFRLKKIHATRVNHTSLLLWPWLAPFIKLLTWKALWKYFRKNPGLDLESRRILTEVAALSSSRKVLLESHLFLEFEKGIESASNFQAKHASSHFIS